MNAISIENTLILNKSQNIPTAGIICAHPGRVKKIASEFLTQTELHTDYRGFQVYTGYFQNQKIFVANTGIGAPAAAFLIEELASFGAKRILRLGSNDSFFCEYKMNIVEKTTLPLGLCEDYDFYPKPIGISESLKEAIQKLTLNFDIPYSFTQNRHIDGYYFINFFDTKKCEGFTSQDMETGALYLLARIRNLECLSILLSYPKHETRGEYQDGGLSEAFENKAIKFSLELLLD